MLVSPDRSSRRTWLLAGGVAAVTLLLACILILLASSFLPSIDILESSSPGPTATTTTGQSGSATVSVLDVDQGQAIAIISPNGHAALIDAGRSQTRIEEEIEPYLRTYGVESIAFVILSHPDQDHVGGMPRVLESFRVGSWIDPAIPSTNQTYAETLEIVLEQGLPAQLARQGQRFQLGGQVDIEILWPVNEMIMSGDEPDSNENSVVVRVTYAGVDVLIPGDLEDGGELALVEQFGAELQSDILVVGHHGSNSSSTAGFLDAVDCDVAVISVGESNPYGHPHGEVLQRLRFRGVDIYRTDLDGTVAISISDGSYTISSVETGVSP